MGETIALGKQLWGQNNGLGRHTLLEEGAYFTPAPGNAYDRSMRQFNYAECIGGVAVLT